MAHAVPQKRSQLSLPRLPVNEGQVTAVGDIAISAAIMAALIGAVLGGLAGMRFHRKVDKAGLEPPNHSTVPFNDSPHDNNPPRPDRA